MPQLTVYQEVVIRLGSCVASDAMKFLCVTDGYTFNR
jgi:hypothetical protein